MHLLRVNSLVIDDSYYMMQCALSTCLFYTFMSRVIDIIHNFCIEI